MSGRRIWLALAAVGGFVSVAAGAFGAHGVADPQARDWLRTGATYGFVHSLAVYAAIFVGQLGGRTKLVPPLFLVGVVLFSGSLYAMALGAPLWFGAITPLGGLCFLAGWALLAWASAHSREAGNPS